MSRTTKGQIEKLFGLYCASIGRRRAKRFDDVGGLALDYNSVYGGYMIVEIVNQSGGQDTPFGMTRHSASTFEAMLRFGINTVQAMSLRSRSSI